tara:strand:- start:759 stop:995 length:237 start_codon:yes stop_codon:yes gene_type:complete
MPELTNNEALNEFIDDDYQVDEYIRAKKKKKTRAYKRAQKIVNKLRNGRKYKELSVNEFLQVREILAEHFDFKLKEEL